MLVDGRATRVRRGHSSVGSNPSLIAGPQDAAIVTAAASAGASCTQWVRRRRTESRWRWRGGTRQWTSPSPVGRVRRVKARRYPLRGAGVTPVLRGYGTEVTA